MPGSALLWQIGADGLLSVTVRGYTLTVQRMLPPFLEYHFLF